MVLNWGVRARWMHSDAVSSSKVSTSPSAFFGRKSSGSSRSYTYSVFGNRPLSLSKKKLWEKISRFLNQFEKWRRFSIHLYVFLTISKIRWSDNLQYWTLSSSDHTHPLSDIGLTPKVPQRSQLSWSRLITNYYKSAYF